MSLRVRLRRLESVRAEILQLEEEELREARKRGREFEERQRAGSGAEGAA